MRIANLSFKTDGRTIVVPPIDKAKGSMKVADKKDLKENLDDYMPYCQAFDGGREEERDI